MYSYIHESGNILEVLHYQGTVIYVNTDSILQCYSI